jgi:uncharacterized membrane protein
LNKRDSQNIDHARIVEAVRSAEARTSAEIRIFVQRGELKGDPVAAAQEAFVRLGMEGTRGRNGVLIYLMPDAEEFTVIGDEEVLRRYGEGRWQEIVDKMGEHFQEGSFTDAMVEAIGYLGGALAQQFRRKWRNPNELSDEVIEG